MPGDFELSATAEDLAQRIYDTSTGCLMAHSIRSVEKYLRETYNFDTQIVLQPCSHVLSDMDRLSWSSVAQNSGHITYIRYWDNTELDNTRRRFCIAHELYHVIWSIGTASSLVRGIGTEQIFDHFANDLCRKHDKFYADQAKINNGDIRFLGLPYRSV